MIKGNFISLKSIEKYDVPRLYELYMEASGGMLNTTYEEVNLGNFIFELYGSENEKNSSKVFCIIYEKDIIGFITLVDIKSVNRSANVGHLVIGKEFRGNKYSIDSVITLIKHSFNNLNLHRIDCYIYGDNYKMGKDFFKHIPGALHEGTNREWGYRNGEWIDRHTWSLLRKDFFRERED